MGDDLVDELDDGGVVRCLAQVDDVGAGLLGLFGGGGVAGDDVLQARHARDQIGDRVGRGDRHAHLVAGHDRYVVDGQHIGGVGHRQQQRALVHERYRHRLIALGGAVDDQVGSAHVDREDVEVEMVQAVALGKRPGKAVGGDRSTCQQHALGRDAFVARGLDCALDALARGEAHVANYIGQETCGGAAPAGAGDARDRFGGVWV